MNPNPPFDPGRRGVVRAAGAVVTALAALAGGAPALAADPPARILVPFPPGGAADLMARILAEKLKDELGRQVLVENKPGAGTRLAAETLKQAAPDGATVLMTTVEPLVIAPMVYRTLRFNPATDFMPISEIASLEFAVVVAGTSPSPARAAPRRATASSAPTGPPSSSSAATSGSAS